MKSRSKIFVNWYTLPRAFILLLVNLSWLSKAWLFPLNFFSDFSLFFLTASFHKWFPVFSGDRISRSYFWYRFILLLLLRLSSFGARLYPWLILLFHQDLLVLDLRNISWIFFLISILTSMCHFQDFSLTAFWEFL